MPLHKGVTRNSDGTTVISEGLRLGTTATAVAGNMRWNSVDAVIEVYDGAGWVALGSPALPQKLTVANLQAAGIASPTAIWNLNDNSEVTGTYPLTGTYTFYMDPWVPGISNRIASTTGAVQNSNAIFRHNAAITFGIKIMLTANAGGGGGHIMGCSYGGGATGANADGWTLLLDGTTQLNYHQANASAFTYQVIGRLALYTPYVIICTRDAAGTTVNIYINGALVANLTGLLVPLAGANAQLSILGETFTYLNGYGSDAFVALDDEASASTVQAITSLMMPVIA